MIYFTSDTHFFHANVIDFCHRPFLTVDEMNDYLVEIWNLTVNENDTVYHLGDISFINQDDTSEIISKLKGKIYVAKGNHDGTGMLNKLKKDGLIEDWSVGYYLKHHKQQLWLTHIPLNIEESRSRMWSVSGHIHDKPSEKYTQINVGVDSDLWKEVSSKREFGQPYSINDILEVTKARKRRIENAKSQT